MTSRTGKRFRRLFRRLPEHVRRQAIAAYALWRADPFHPSLNFKRLRGSRTLWSVRVGLHHRAVGRRTGDRVTWFWIGPHDGYDTVAATSGGR